MAWQSQCCLARAMLKTYGMYSLSALFRHKNIYPVRLKSNKQQQGYPLPILFITDDWDSKILGFLFTSSKKCQDSNLLRNANLFI